MPSKDLGCFDFVPHDSSGACECAGGHMAAATDCEHEGFTCQKECRLLRQRRRRQKAAGQRAAGLTPTSAVDAGHEKLFAVGAFGAKDARGGLLDGFGLLCSDGSRTAIAGSANKTAASGWEFVCPGWEVCRDVEPHCTEWAERGECKHNPGYMHVICPRACRTCPEVAQVAAGAAHALVGLDVRGGNMVDAVRLHCGPVADAMEAVMEDAGDGDARNGEAHVQAESSLVSEWFGGTGGHECALTCDSHNLTDGWRTGGVVQSITVSSGQRVDRLELARCSKDLEV